jgi:GGDEF domain-containing protein
MMRKLLLAGFVIIFASILFYAIPWLPYGLSEEDYNNRLTLLMLLVLAAGVSAFGAVYFREYGNRLEQTILTWTTVHEGLGELRQREYFYDRLVIECQRAQATGSRFSVVALRINEPEDSGTHIAAALIALKPVVRDSDCLAALGPHEIGVLAPRIQGSEAESFADHLRRLVSAATTRDGGRDVHAGWAVYGRDADEAGALVGIARERMLGRKPYVPTAPEPAPAPEYPAA